MRSKAPRNRTRASSCAFRGESRWVGWWMEGEWGWGVLRLQEIQVMRNPQSILGALLRPSRVDANMTLAATSLGVPNTANVPEWAGAQDATKADLDSPWLRRRPKPRQKQRPHHRQHRGEILRFSQDFVLVDFCFWRLVFAWLALRPRNAARSLHGKASLSEETV